MERIVGANATADKAHVLFAEQGYAAEKDGLI